MSDMGHVRSDDIEGAIEGTLRTMVAAAGRMGERLARIREDAARRAEAQDTQRARAYQAQLEQERATARAQLRPLNEPVWWDRANANDIAYAYETASAWQGEDPSIADAAAKMRDELRERYGIDTENIGADPAQVAEALSQREAQLDLAADSRDDAQQDRQDRQDAATLVQQANAHDRDAEEARAAGTDGRTAADRPTGSVGQDFGEEYGDEPARHDPNAERTITLTLNEYEAERIDKLLTQSEWSARQPFDEHDFDREDPRSIDQIERGQRDIAESSTGMRERLATARSAAAEDRTAAGGKWDSADRRDGHAAELAAAGVEPVAVQAQYGADVSNAKHPRGAVASTRGAAKARKTATKGFAAQRDRDRSR